MPIKTMGLIDLLAWRVTSDVPFGGVSERVVFEVADRSPEATAQAIGAQARAAMARQ